MTAGVRPITLVLAALATTVVAWLLMRLAFADSVVPNPGWVAIAVMLFLGGGLLGAGWQVRKVRDRAAGAYLSPLRATRTLVLAQAGALTGAVLVGWYAANVLLLVPNIDVDSQRGRIWVFVAHALVALLLCAAGMVVQHWCRVRPCDDDGDDGLG